MYRFSTNSFSMSIKVTDRNGGTVLLHRQYNQLTSLVLVPKTLKYNQADFDTWVDNQAVAPSHDVTTVMCVAQMLTGAPFADRKKALTIAHNCDAKLLINLTFPYFSGDFIQTLEQFGTGCE
jgi:hypothetical protein